MSTLVQLLSAARTAGLTIDRDGERLTVRGPKNAGPIVAALQRRKADVLLVVDFYSGISGGLDWRAARVERPLPCLLCGKGAHLRDPYDGRPMHKICAESAIGSSAVDAIEAAV